MSTYVPYFQNICHVFCGSNSVPLTVNKVMKKLICILKDLVAGSMMLRNQG